MSRRAGPIVTLDGPAGSGKSTTAREVARRLGFRHLDSGALYRALTYALIESGVDEAEWPHLTQADMDALGVDVVPAGDRFDVVVGDRVVSEALRAPEVTARVAKLAGLPTTRASLLALQRGAGRFGDLVADGRDMGSVVFPDAEAKFYLVADLKERARRRLLEEGVGHPSAELVAAQAEEMAQRDRADSERVHSPLRRPSDAHLIDTTRLDFEDQVQTIVTWVRRLTRE
jgi:cytidylate kinase